MVKFGRLKMIIREIKIENSSDVNDNDTLENRTKYFGTKANEVLKKPDAEVLLNNFASIKKNKNVCRICYCDENEVDSPLIQPCLCSGTMKYIHHSCLKHWLNLKVVARPLNNETCMSYSLKRVECELCKAALPDYVRHKDKLYPIWDFKPTYKSYVTFETLVSDKHTSRMVYVLNFDNKQSIKLGRGHEAEIRVSDISVSRFHAIILKNKDGTLSLEDNNSKFGTQVLLQNSNMRILSNHSLPLQIGRTFIILSIQKTCSLFFCCKSVNNEDKLMDYQILNSRSIVFEKCCVVKTEIEDTDTVSECKEESSIEIPKKEPAENFFKVIEGKDDIDIEMEMENINLEIANQNKEGEMRGSILERRMTNYDNLENERKRSSIVKCKGLEMQDQNKIEIPEEVEESQSKISKNVQESHIKCEIMAKNNDNISIQINEDGVSSSKVEIEKGNDNDNDDPNNPCNEMIEEDLPKIPR